MHFNRIGIVLSLIVSLALGFPSELRAESQRVVSSYSGSFWSLHGDGLPKNVVVSRSFYLIHPLKLSFLWESRASVTEMENATVFELREWQLFDGSP